MTYTADGLTYTLGIFIVEFMWYFEEGSEATSWIASIMVGVTLGSGYFIVSVLISTCLKKKNTLY